MGTTIQVLKSIIEKYEREEAKDGFHTAEDTIAYCLALLARQRIL